MPVIQANSPENSTNAAEVLMTLGFARSFNGFGNLRRRFPSNAGGEPSCLLSSRPVSSLELSYWLLSCLPDATRPPAPAFRLQLPTRRSLRSRARSEERV